MISIIIAAYNEEKRIKPSLLKVKEYLTRQGMDYEIIVVDDGSTDNTTRVVTDVTQAIPHILVIQYKTNRGKGYALRKGVLASKGEIVLVTDADLSTPIEELDKLLPFISENQCDIAIGSRALALSKIIKKQPWWRQGMGKMFNRIVKTLVINDFDDTQCGFKVFSGNVGREIFKKARIDRFAYDVEILTLATKREYKIMEVPVRWINSPESKVNPIIDSIRMLIDLFRIRFTVGHVKKN